MLYSPNTLLESLKKYESLLIEKSGLSTDELNTLLSLILGKIIVVEKEKYQHYMNEAYELIGTIDKDDVPYLALALSINCDGIWSEDNHFQRQTKVKTWKTAEIINRVEELERDG